MTGKERVERALDHQEGPIPIDFGSSAGTGMHVSIVEGLRSYYGLPKHPVRVFEPYQMLGEIEEDLKSILQIDTVPIFPYSTIYGFPLDTEGWKEWRTPWMQEVLVPTGFETTSSADEVVLYPMGDRTARPSARMPEGAYFFDTIVRQPPFVEDELQIEDNLEEFSRLGPAELAYFQNAAARLSGRRAQ